MELYLIRHGKTIWNAENKLQGRADIDLAPEGIEVAKKSAERLASIHFDRIFSSPLIRAYKTAEILRGNRNIPIEKDDRLRELSFGVFEGHTYSELESQDNPFRYFFTEPGKFLPPEDGESIESCCARTKDFIQNVIEPLASSTERVMIVAHGALNASIMCYLENHDKAHFWGSGLQNNCEETVFTFDEKGWHRK